jgi:hypothetical protein
MVLTKINLIVEGICVVSYLQEDQENCEDFGSILVLIWSSRFWSTLLVALLLDVGLEFLLSLAYSLQHWFGERRVFETILFTEHNIFYSPTLFMFFFEYC